MLCCCTHVLQMDICYGVTLSETVDSGVERVFGEIPAQPSSCRLTFHDRWADRCKDLSVSESGTTLLAERQTEEEGR